MTYEISTTSSADTASLAAKLADHLTGGETIELVSDLGGGKTTFVQGLAKAMGYDGAVTSPTFTLSHIYRLPNGQEIHHYDLYRLGQGGIVGEELAEDIADTRLTTVVEWAEVVSNELPTDRLRIAITVTGENQRMFSLSSGGPVSDDIIRGLTS